MVPPTRTQAELTELLAPFYWVQRQTSFSVCLIMGQFMPKLFEPRFEEGFDGSGYDWASMAGLFLEERMPELKDAIRFDPEADIFCAYSADGKALEAFALAFRQALNDEAVTNDLAARAPLD